MFIVTRITGVLTLFSPKRILQYIIITLIIVFLIFSIKKKPQTAAQITAFSLLSSIFKAAFNTSIPYTNKIYFSLIPEIPAVYIFKKYE